MGSRMPSHILGNGLFVSGYREKPKEKMPTMWSSAIPYTGGDVRQSGELGMMFDIPVECSNSRNSGSMNTHTSTRSMGVSSSSSMKKTNSCPLNKHGEPLRRFSGSLSSTITPMNHRQYSGPQLPVTGLITSGPVSYNPPKVSRSRKNSGRLNSKSSINVCGSSISNNVAVTNLGRDKECSFRRKIPRLVVLASIVLFTMGLIVGGFIFGAVKNVIFLAVVAVLFSMFGSVLLWNYLWWRNAVIGYIDRHPVSELRTAKDGDYVKITGVVTCGNVPLRSSFKQLPRCIYTSASLQEYRGGCGSDAVTPTQRQVTWANRFSEKHAVDFYISDFQSGLRALVKAGHGAHVAPYVDETVSITVYLAKRDAPPEFIQWLCERNIRLDDSLVRLKEGCIKEGSTVTVMGVVQRNENVLTIVAPEEAEVMGCQWWKCIFPGTCEGIVVRCEDTSGVEEV